MNKTGIYKNNIETKAMESEMAFAGRMLAGLAEIMSLGMFIGMVWLWAAVVSVPGV